MRIVMHGHHASTLFSYFVDEEAVAQRVTFINAVKAANECALRLALLQDVTDLLPHNAERVTLEKAWKILEKAGEAYNKAWEACDRARAAHLKAQEAHLKALAACGEAVVAFDKVREVYDKARAATVKAWEACDRAQGGFEEEKAYQEERETLEKAREAYDRAIYAWSISFDAEAFHREHCHPHCPWDGKSIFSKGTNVKVLSRLDEQSGHCILCGKQGAHTCNPAARHKLND